MSVQKYEFSKDASGFTVVSNKVIQKLTNPEALGLWIYLMSMPTEWEFYKSVIRQHFKMGANKLDKLFNILQAHQLLSITYQRGNYGRYAKGFIHVRNGDAFIEKPIPNENKELTYAQPCHENPCMDNHEMDSRTYKRKIKKTNIINKRNIICAEEPARENEESSSFNNFWNLYPRKRDMRRAQKVWNKAGLDKIADVICEDVKKRLQNDRQWENAQYIPYPATYLNNKRWTDEIELKTVPIAKPTSVDRALGFLNKVGTLCSGL